MSNWGMNPDSLYGAGGNISNLETDAGAAGKGLLDAAAEAGGAVFHPIMKGAIDGFIENWSGPTNRLVHNVDAAGSQVKDAAVTGDQADADAFADVLPAATGVSEQASVLSKPINDSIV